MILSRDWMTDFCSTSKFLITRTAHNCPRVRAVDYDILTTVLCALESKKQSVGLFFSATACIYSTTQMAEWIESMPLEL